MPSPALFFDLDGTLVDSEGIAVDAAREVLASLGVTLRSEEENYIVGRTWAEAAQGLVARYSLPLAAEPLAATMIEVYRRRTKDGMTPVPGAVEAVRRLQERYRLLVVSGSPRRDIEHALDSLRIADAFVSLVGAEDYRRSKPAPDPYHEAMARVAAAPAECLVFEDSEAGVRAALAAGIKVVAVTAAQRTPQDIRAAQWRIVDWTAVTVAWIEERVEKAVRGREKSG